MVEVKLCASAPHEVAASAYVFLLPEAETSSTNVSAQALFAGVDLPAFLKARNFEFKAGQLLVSTVPRDGEMVHVIFCGVGKDFNKKNRFVETVRRAWGSAVNQLRSLNVKNAVCCSSSLEVPGDVLVKELTTIAFMAAYKFDRFKKNKDEKEPWSCEITLAQRDNEEPVREGTIIGKAINVTRDLADMPANIATPTFVANYASSIAKQYGLESKVFGRDEAEKLGMGGFCAVDSGSAQPGQFVVLEYKGDSSAETIALVGKGVTFDTGGVSLKPAQFMTGMKYDMSGAAAVIGTMEAIAQLKPKANVVGIMPLVENMPSGDACRQDDIITFMNGKTAVIENTDAEGRLILADALCYAEKNYSPSVILDAATLTGACLYALGPVFTGLMTKDDELCDKIFEIGSRLGDRLWPLPLDDDFKDAIKSEVADISNCGSPKYKAGAITAGIFLSNFVEKSRWAHLDIAGTADSVPGVSYLGSGATGVPVRLFVEFVKNM
ncbi:leucyl aminopeptidase [bacterium]|nr:leucyl aminopeptidase [bacterium]